MLEVEQWVQERGGHPFLLFAVLASSSIDAVGQMFEFVKADSLFKEPVPEPVAAEWVSLYSNHRRIRVAITEGFLQLAPSIAERFAELDFEDTELPGPGDSAGWEQLFHKGKSVIAAFEKVVLDDLRGDDAAIEGNGEFFLRPEYLFFIRITLPAWMLYGESPARLFRRARRGDANAFLKLLNLDKLVLEDLGLRHLFFQLRRSKDHLRDVEKALNGKLCRTPDAGDIKNLVAGMISALFSEWDEGSKSLNEQFPQYQTPRFRMTEPDIRALFDAHARDQGLEQDDDLPESPEAFYKAIYRARRFWKGSMPGFL